VVVNPPQLRLERGGPPGDVPFAGGGAAPLRIVASARALPKWTMDPRGQNSPAEPPPSPVDCGDAATPCGGAEDVVLVPFGTTRLRMGLLPWTVGAAATPYTRPGAHLVL